MDFYIFRHGETYYSKHNIPYGLNVENASILPESIPITKRLAEYLKNINTDCHMASPYLRCRQTVEIVEQITGKEFEYDDLLHDYNPNLESVTDTAKRTKKFYENISQKDYKQIAICTHGYPIAMLKSIITKGYINTNPERLVYPQTGVLLIIKNKKISFVDFN